MVLFMTLPSPCLLLPCRPSGYLSHWPEAGPCDLFPSMVTCELWLSLAPASHCFHGLIPARESHGAAVNPSEHWLIPRLMEQKEILFAINHGGLGLLSSTITDVVDNECIVTEIFGQCPLCLLLGFMLTLQRLNHLSRNSRQCPSKHSPPKRRKSCSYTKTPGCSKICQSFPWILLFLIYFTYFLCLLII